VLQAVDAVMGAASRVVAPFSAVALSGNRVLLISVDLPEPETPVTQVSRPIGISRSTLLQVVAARALDLQQVVSPGSRGVRLAGTAIFTRPDRYLPVSESGWAMTSGRALGDDLSAMHPGTRADIHHVVGHADGVFVVLDHDHRVAHIAQVAQGAKQAFVVALMQADARLVEDIHDTDQARADLAGQADTLGFAAGKGVGAAVQVR
jgi:hypothetical protein